MRTLAPFVLLALPLTLAAQEPSAPAQSPTVAHANAPGVQAARLTSSIRLDGRLDEEAWAAATPITTFTQIVPTEGSPASERTEVRFAYDSDALYIGARMFDSQPVTSRLGRRDMSMEASDWLTIILDTYHDHRTAVGFEINPSGVRRDQTRSPASEDDSWEPVWEAATAIDEEGWTAEIRIPFSQLRFNPASEQTWGLQVERQIARMSEFSVFSFTPSTQPGGIARFGHLHGLRDLRPGKRLEVLPYTVVRTDAVDRSANPYRSNRETEASAGADLKYRITSDLTLDVTVNPDFGQVEVDPAEVNLSAIETFFQERRPFFVEGSEIFNFGAGGGNNAFYTRRIGRAPQILPSTRAVNVADAAGILGAAKLSGRTSGGWSVGVLDALTGREEAVYRGSDGDDLRMTAEPRTNYFAGRARRDFRSGQSVLGGMLTAVNRDLDTDLARDRLRSAAYMGGVDFRHEWARRTWVLNGFVAGSHIRGSETAMAAAQRAPWRYFQRPDAEHLELDPTRTSLSGVSTQVDLAYRHGRHWRYALLAGTTTPGYEVNDMGFQYRADRMDGQASVTYVDNRPGRFFRLWQVSGTGRGERNYDGDRILDIYQVNAYGQHLKYWSVSLSGTASLRAFDDRLTRGGPAAIRPANQRMFLGLYSDSRQRISGGVETGNQRDEAGGWNSFIGLFATARPASTVNFTLTPIFRRQNTRAQYLGVVTDENADRTFGRRYLFAELDQTTFSLQTRVNVTLTPTLSLQVYAQPLISSAAFVRPSELRAPNTYDFLVYGRDIGTVERVEGGIFVDPDGPSQPSQPFTLFDSDFNVRSLRGNAVVRWEWRPGSTLFVAWQQSRSNTEPFGNFEFARDRSALFAARPDNVFVVKMNYWFNP